MINIRQRRQQISAFVLEKGYQTIRSIASATGIPKSSVHRHQQSLKRQAQQPETELWQTTAGEQWLKRLVVATVYVFGLKRGVGAESLSEFFHHLGLDAQVGVSVTSVRKIQDKLEAEILAYQQAQHEHLSQACQSLPTICVGVDETWFDSTVLVMMELASGYILAEEMVEDHRYTTWQTTVAQVVKRWGKSIRYCVNDRAKALIKLALDDFNCASIADLFHAMRKLTHGIGFDLERRLTHLRRRLRESPTQTAQTTALQLEYRELQSAQVEFQEYLINITLGLHPFDATTLGAQTAQQVEAKLHQQVEGLKQLRTKHHLKDTPGGIDKFTRQIETLSSVVTLWWQWVEQSLAAHSVADTLRVWLTSLVLPMCYWHYQAQRTDQPTLRQRYQAAYEQAQLHLQAHSLTATLAETTRGYWYSWASEMVTKFQRTTAAVEGRNGYLTQIYRSRRGLSARRLRVMTAIHNFDLKRPDGSTAAERLFKVTHPNLFQSVLAQMPDLPLPRRRRHSPSPQTSHIASVPA